MCDLIYRGGILKTKPGKKDSAVDAILADKEFAILQVVILMRSWKRSDST